MLPSNIQRLTDFDRETQVGLTGGAVTSSSVEGTAVLLQSFQNMFSGYIVVWVQLVVTLAGLIWNSGRVRYVNTDGFNRYLLGTYLGTQNS